MKKTFFVFVIVCAAYTCSCAGDCISVGGSYGDKLKGNVQYCFNKSLSEQIGIPAWTAGDGKLFGLSEDDVKKIVEKLKEKAGVVSTSTIDVRTPIAQLLDVIRPKK